MSEVTSFETSDQRKSQNSFSKPSGIDFTGLGLSTDALALTIEFNNDENIQKDEEVEQHKKMLNLFLRISKESPQFLVTKDPRLLPLSTPNAHVARPNLPLNKFSITSQLSKYFSCTRPTWLPPKSDFDNRKHKKESEDIILQAIAKESRLHEQRTKKLQELKAMKEKDMLVWDNIDLPDMSNLKNLPVFRDIYWRGIPSAKRSHVWFQRMGSNVTKHFCDQYFDQCNSKLFSMKAGDSPDEGTNSQLGTLLERIKHDLLHTFPEMNYFQESSISKDLTMVIVSLIIHLDKTFSQGDGVHFSSRFFSFYFTGLNNLAALLYYVYGDIHMVFASLCNIFTRDELLSVLIAIRQEGSSSNKEVLEDQVLQSYFNDFEARFTLEIPRLYTHFKLAGLGVLEYAPDILIGLFSNYFDFKMSLQVVDIWINEGSEFLLSALLAMLKKLSFKLFGSKAEILRILDEQHRDTLNTTQKKVAPNSCDTYKYLNVGYSHEFLASIQNVN